MESLVRSGAASRGAPPGRIRRLLVDRISSSATQYVEAERVVGRRHLLPALLARLALLRLRARRLLADDRRLATRTAHAHQPRPRRLADGAAPPRSGRRR